MNTCVHPDGGVIVSPEFPLIYVSSAFPFAIPLTYAVEAVEVMPLFVVTLPTRAIAMFLFVYTLLLNPETLMYTVVVAALTSYASAVFAVVRNKGIGELIFAPPFGGMTTE